MRRVLSIVMVVALAGSTWAITSGVSSAASTSTELKTRKVKVGKTGYKMTLEKYGDSVMIELHKRYGENGLEQSHRFNFEVKKMFVSKDLKSGRIVSGGKMGGFGMFFLKFRPTKPIEVKKTCGGEIVTRKRNGVFEGKFRFKPDTQGNAFFKTIKFTKLRAVVKRITEKNCQTTPTYPCPTEVALFAEGTRAGKLASGAVRAQVNVHEDAEPAMFINHYAGGRVNDPSKMTFAADLSSAQADFSAADPLISGVLNFAANQPLQQVQTGSCGESQMWASEARSGAVTGSVTVHFDSYGDVTISPTQGFMQRWYTF